MNRTALIALSMLLVMALTGAPPAWAPGRLESSFAGSDFKSPNSCLSRALRKRLR